MASAGGTGDYNMEVYVTHVKLNRELGQVNFWAQLSPEGAEQLEELDVLIQDKANTDPYPPEPKSLLVGEPCLANFIEDSRWYRARVEQCTENDVIAYFIDYGNTEIIPFNLIRRADASVFADLKPQATECILEGVNMAEKSGVLSYIKKLMNDQSFLGKPAGFVAGRAHMTLQMETESREGLAERIIRDGFGFPMKVRKPSGSGGGHAGGGGDDRKVVQFRNMGLDVGSREKLYISHIESPSSFWIQQSCISLDLDNLMNDLSQFYCEGPGGQVVRRAEDGMPCVALFSEDETFYRATVDKMLANNECRVLFVDYGNKEVTAVSNLRVITDEFLKLPTIAIRCCLSGIEEASCAGPEATARFEGLTGEKELCGKVVGFKGDKCAILLVNPNGKENADIAGVLVKEGLAKRDQEQFPMKGTRRTSERTGRASPVSSTSSSGSLPQPRGRMRSDEIMAARAEPQIPTASYTTPSLRPGSKHQVQVTSVESLTSFSSQMLKDTEEFDEMMASLQDAYASGDTRLSTLHIDQPCCAQFTEDDSWYRAQITAISGSSCDVTYVDYGNSETISGSRLRVLKSQFFQLPLQCILCSLDGINPQDAMAPKARNHFESITSEKTLIAAIVSIRHVGKHDVYGVILTEEGTGVNMNKEMQKFLQSSRTPPRDQLQSFQPARSSGRDQFQSAQPPRGQQQQQGGFGQQRTPPRDQFQKSVKSPPRNDSQFGSQDRGSQDRSNQGFGQPAAPAKQAPSPGRASAPAPAEPITFTEVQLPNRPLQVYLSHGSSPIEFWCQLVGSSSELDELMEKIHTKYSGKSALPNLKNMAVGTPCIAQFSEDQGWYRAVVINKHVGELEVLFVDYGNSERVKMAKVKQITPDLMKLPAQAVKCAIKGWDLGAAQPKVISRMRELANTVEQFKCDSHGNSGGVYEVELSCSGMRMGQELRKVQTQALQEKKQKEASAAAAAAAAAAPPKPKPAPPSPARAASGLMIGSAIDNIKVNAHEDFIISHADNPGRFWCQLAKDCTTLDEMMVKLNDHYNGNSGDALESMLVGTFCVAKYAADEGWYRAQISKTISVSQVEVHFIDYGNNDVVDVGDLRKIRPEFTKLKSQAVQCALVEHKGETYEQDLISKFEELVMEKQLVGDVKAKRAGMLAMQLFDTAGDHDLNINEEVMNMMGSEVVGFPPHAHLLTECEVYATHIEGPHQFFVQMSSQTEAIDNMSAKLQDAYASVGPNQLVMPQSSVGQACCAKFSEDEQWYRAVVTNKPSSARAKVRFVDFGNSEEQDVTQLKTLKEDFLSQVPLAVECRLGKCMKNVNGTQKKMEELMMDKPLMCSFHGNTIAPFGVTLMDGDTNVNAEMSGLVGTAATKTASDEDSTSPYPWPSVSKDCVEVSLTNITNPWDFWCQLSTDGLNQLTNSMQDTYREQGDNTNSDVLPGSPCICQEGDSTWYRGEVIGLPSEDQAEVLFVDSGVTVTVPRSKVWPIDDNFMSLPRQAIRCRLSTVKPCSPDWDEASVSGFKKMTAGNGLIAEVLGIDRGGGAQDPCYTILLRSREGALISDLLTERRLAEQVAMDTEEIMPQTSAWKGKTYPRENLTSTKQDVNVVRADNPSQFIVKPLHFLAMEEDLKREIEAFTEGILGNLVLPDWLPTAEIGMPCLAMRKDNNKWCRAEVQSVLPKGGIIVDLVDEGVRQIVFPSDLRPINAKLVDMPAMVVECKLKDVAPMRGDFWEESVCDVFKDMVLDQKMEIAVDDDGADLFKEVEVCEEIREVDGEGVKEEDEKAIKESSEEKQEEDEKKEPEESTEDTEVEVTEESKAEDTEEDNEITEDIKNNEEIKEEDTEEKKEEDTEELKEESTEEKEADDTEEVKEVTDEKTKEDAEENKEESPEEIKKVTEENKEEDTKEKKEGDTEESKEGNTEDNEEITEEDKEITEENEEDKEIKEEETAEKEADTEQPKEEDTEDSKETEQKEEVSVETKEEASEEKEEVDSGVEKEDENEEEEIDIPEVEESEENKVDSEETKDEPTEEIKEEVRVITKSVSELLKEMGLARVPGTEPEEEEEEVIIADPDTPVSLYFLSVKGPSELICQPAASADKLQELMNSIFEFYSDESNRGGVTPEVGLQCIAKFTEDDGWYRATIEAIEDAEVKVRYTDYGNSEVLTEDRLCNLQPQFAKLRAQAIRFQVTQPLMEESAWNFDVKVHLEECCVERELTVNILDTSGEQPIIRLSPDDTTFFQQSVASYAPPHAPVAELQPATPALAADDSVLDDAISMIFLSAEGPSTLLCQPLSTADDLAILMDNIAAHYEDEANQTAFTSGVGQQCIAKFTEDDGWYRAEVKAVNDSSITIRYIDYGNSEALTPDRLCPIKAEFTQLLPQAIAYEITPPLMQSSQWNDDVKAVLDEHCAERELNGSLLPASGSVPTVELSEGDMNFIKTTLGNSLTPVGTAVADTTPVSDTKEIFGEAITLIFLSADGPSTLICQPMSTADDLAILMDNIAAHYEDEANQAEFTPVVSQQCIAKFTEDDGWYRADVKAVNDGSVTVRYIDYGNLEALTPDRLCPIQGEFTQLPAQAVAYKVEPPLMHASQWNDDVKTLLDDSCLERELKGSLLESGDVPVIKLSDDDTAFIKTGFGDTLPPVVEAAPKTEEVLKLGEAIDLLFLSADGYSSFSCQPMSTADALATLMDEIAAFYEEEANQVEYTPKMGQQCIAQFTEDDGWYRAIVQEINEDEYLVKYVDYGNAESLKQDRLHEIQPQFQELPNQAIVYKVKPDLMHPSQWTDDVKAALDESCAERELKGHLVVTSDDSLTVKLIKDDEDFIKSSVVSILPPVVADAKDEVDDIVESLVNTAITDAIEEMTTPATIQEAAGVTVMTLFDKVATSLLMDELKKDDVPRESDTQDASELEEDTMTGVKKLVDDIVKRAVETVAGEQERDLPHQILDEIIESVADGLHISSASEVLEEHPQRKRHKSGEGLPGMEGDAGDERGTEEALPEESKEVGELEEKYPKIKAGESDNNEEDEEKEDKEKGQENHGGEEETSVVPKVEEEEDQEKGQEDHDEEDQEEETFEDAEDDVAANDETADAGDKPTQEVAETEAALTEEKADSDIAPDQADEDKPQDDSKDDQEESFESAPSTPERDSTSENTQPAENNVESAEPAENNAEAAELAENNVESEEVNNANHNNEVDEKGDSEKSEQEQSSDSKTAGDKVTGDVVDDVGGTEEATEG